jgi:DNA-binding CsgD family transcriptional regulator
MADHIDLIAAIYDAVLEPSDWDEVVKRIVEATKSLSGGLASQGDVAHLAALYNTDPFYIAAYIETYHKLNPLNAFAARLAPGEIRTGTLVLQTDTYKASAFHNEYARPQGWADVVAIGLSRAPNTFVNLSLQRSPDAVWVEEAEWHLLETLAPHLQQAVALHQLLAHAKATTDSLGAAVAAAGFAVFLLSGDCRVAFANAKAEDLVRRRAGLRYERGQLAAATVSLTHRLHALAREAARPGRSEGDIGGTVELPRGNGGPPLLAHVIPLAANRAVTIFDFDRPAAAVFVVDPAAGFNAATTRFATRFGLTPAETRVLGEIIGGNGVLAAATKLEITEATARTHAKRIFDKTGTQRQTELIRRFFETTLPGSPPAA